jgi:hypothetical protein
MPTKKDKTTKKKIIEESTMSLSEIESEMLKLVQTMDRTNYFLNSKKLEALNLIAQQKLKRAELESKTNANSENTHNEPIKVEFVSNSSEEDRINKLQSEVEDAIGGVGNA